MRATLNCSSGLSLTFVWMVLMLDLCYARPPTDDNWKPQPDSDQAKHRENLLKSIREQFMSNLEKLKIKAPSVHKFNFSVAEKREHIRKYKQHLEAKNSWHKLYEKEPESPGEVFCFKDTDASQGSNRHLPSVYFPMDITHPSDPKRETVVTSAELKLYKVPVAHTHLPVDNVLHQNRPHTVVELYQLLKPVANSTKPHKKLVGSKILRNRSAGWESFDITDVVRHWFDHPHDNLGLEVEHRALSGHRMRILTRNSQGLGSTDILSDSLLPSLKVSTEKRHILGRMKRAPATYDCKQGDGEKRCCRYPLYVNFSDIGWDEWVIAPEGYQAYYCDGACPDRYKPANNFAGIKSILHILNPNAVPGPCCSATETASLDLVHLDEDNDLIVTEYEGMIVQDCKCS